MWQNIYNPQTHIIKKKQFPLKMRIKCQLCVNKHFMKFAQDFKRFDKSFIASYKWSLNCDKIYEQQLYIHIIIEANNHYSKTRFSFRRVIQERKKEISIFFYVAVTGTC